jgi:hypothetical protein
VGIITKFFVLCSLVGATCLGIVILAYEKGVRGRKLVGLFIVLFGAFKFALFMCTMIVGVPMDSSYAFGVNAIMFSKAAFIFIAVAIMVIAIVAFTMLSKAFELFTWIWKISVLLVFLVVLAVFVVPRVYAL